MAIKIIAGDLYNLREHLNRVAISPQIQRDQICLAIGQDRQRRQAPLKMAPMMQFGECRLHRAIPPV